MSVQRWTDPDGYHYFEVEDDVFFPTFYTRDPLTGAVVADAAALNICDGLQFWANMDFYYMSNLDYYVGAYLVLDTPQAWQTAYGVAYLTPVTTGWMTGHILQAAYPGTFQAGSLGETGISTSIHLWIAWNDQYGQERENGLVMTLNAGSVYHNIPAHFSNQSYQFARKVG